MRLRVLSLLIFVTSGAQAQDFCGTNDRVLGRFETFAEWHAAQQQERPRIAASRRGPGLTVQNDVIVLTADDRIAPFRRPVDLAGRTLTFTPTGSGVYRLENGPLSYDPAIGSKVELSGSPRQAVHSLTRFKFPFFGREVDKSHISKFQSISIEPMVQPAVGQYFGADAVLAHPGTIAPSLLTDERDERFDPEVYVSETETAVNVTWIRGDWSDLRVSLGRDGTIRFAYVRLEAWLTAGATFISSPDGAWRDRLTLLRTLSDGTGDVRSGTPAALVPVLDTTAVRFHRVADIDRVRVEFEVAGDLGSTAMTASSNVLFHVSMKTPSRSFTPVSVYLQPDGAYVTTPFLFHEKSNDVVVRGRTVSVDVPQAAFEPGGEATIWSYACSGTSSIRCNVADEIKAALAFDAPPRPSNLDLSETGTREVAEPIVEAFTVPELNLRAAWEILKTDLGLTDYSYDGVAFYPTFVDTFIAFSGYAAFATGGNPGVDGIGGGSSSKRPRTPNLMHMGEVPRRQLLERYELVHLEMHEFGHRWLYGARFLDGATTSNQLGPCSRHPAAWVDTRSPFIPDSSAMGGALFEDLGGGTFRAQPTKAQGFSWLDLYFMGLASPGEVTPFFFIKNATPSLRCEYYPAGAGPYRGERQDVTMGQVLGAMGPRFPKYPVTQRVFSVLFVLIHEPERTDVSAEVSTLRLAATLFEKHFAIGTNNRGLLRTQFSEPGRRRGVRH